jgi:hypothetical protein
MEFCNDDTRGTLCLYSESDRSLLAAFDRSFRQVGRACIIIFTNEYFYGHFQTIVPMKNKFVNHRTNCIRELRRRFSWSDIYKTIAMTSRETLLTLPKNG